MDIDILSLVVVYVPTFCVGLWINKHVPQGSRNFLITTGPAVLVGGIFAYFGAKYLDISVSGRHTTLRGDSAVLAGVLLISIGIIMTVLHFILMKILPEWMKRKKRKND